MKQQSLPRRLKYDNFRHLHHKPIWTVSPTDNYITRAKKLESVKEEAYKLADTLIQEARKDILSPELMSGSSNMEAATYIFSLLAHNRAHCERQICLDSLINMNYEELAPGERSKIKTVLLMSGLIDEVHGGLTFAYDSVIMGENRIYFTWGDHVEVSEEQFLMQTLSYIGSRGKYPNCLEWESDFCNTSRKSFIEKGIFRRHHGRYVPSFV